MLVWLVHSADWLSALFGLAAALVLAWPLVGELSGRREFDEVARLKRTGRAVGRGGLPASGEPLDDVRDQMVDERLGGYRSLLKTVLAGLTLLAISFAFAMLYALTKNG